MEESLNLNVEVSFFISNLIHIFDRISLSKPDFYSMKSVAEIESVKKLSFTSVSSLSPKKAFMILVFQSLIFNPFIYRLTC